MSKVTPILKSSRQGKSPGPDSIMWRGASDILMFPFALPVLAMQTAHPAVGEAVAEYSIYQEDPWGRLMRSSSSLVRFIHGGKDGELGRQEARDLRKLHSFIKGTLPDGARYSALEPQTYRIVPDTIFEITVRMRRLMGNPMSRTEEEELYEEYKDLCLLFGIPESEIEETVDEFWVYWDDLVRNKMTYNKTVKHLLENIPKQGVRKPPFLPIPDSWWDSFIENVAGPFARLTGVGLIDPTYRDRTDLKWTAQDEKNLETLFQVVNLIEKVVPRFLRYNPLALYIAWGGYGFKLTTYEQLQKHKKKDTAAA